uniref:Centromere protein S n=1 Tax=Pseudictyota dubia TaxID=2749911 RepID=A0A7R9ZA28_9STRA|mmetsp:Transcript_31155/g.57570  ORF Transcript_31155/g.57570 Transcript_31155/m.57570 type:complete len:272 (+) Transcript_31155:245-1060(+)|eukprot:CAMPEP_0197460446 /NCGR_PEP_ID=MMETSP1175-20131217/54071_1 /TAXON_ID=1003142 /ORGANISM="Triceratium dubium, Strain CCMP147" /LENGTH=271 /DNA_ID=CAMNT_0042995531 /DNA_START=241 /DNA_END=1056 /DNA_ORIENTATION=-
MEAQRDDDSSSQSSSVQASSLRKATPRQTIQDNDGDALRSALHFAVGRICHEEELEQDDCARMTSEAIAALTELVYQYTTTSLANDLVSFSRHANRRTISVDDVKLVLRKDPDGLLASLEKFCGNNSLGTSGVRGKGKRTAGKKVQKDKARGRTLLQSFEGGPKSKSPRDRRREEIRRKTDGLSSSQQSSENTEDSSDLGLKSSDDEMNCDSGNEHGLAVKRSSNQIDAQRKAAGTSSDESDEEPIMRRHRKRRNGKQAPRNKAIDLTEDD